MSDSYTVVPLSPLRKVIAARMSAASRDIPHYRLCADVELDQLLELRKTLRERSPDAGLTLNDLLVKACAAALMEVPAVNVQWHDGQIHQYHTADISIVIAVPGGLATPIVRGVESKTLAQISDEIRSLATRASKNALRMDEIVGGSFSISNLGMYGVDQFDAIINAPQCAILAIGAAKPCMRVSQEREPRIATVARMTLSLDHRAIDGATGATFLAALRRRIEHPEQPL